MAKSRSTTTGGEVVKAARKSSRKKSSSTSKKKNYVQHSTPYGGYTVLVHQHYRTPRR